MADKRVGRPPKGARAMTDAERQATYKRRLLEKAREEGRREARKEADLKPKKEDS